MRSDELPARLILDVLHDRGIFLRSPEAKRLWTYGEDIVDFYERLWGIPSRTWADAPLRGTRTRDGRIVANVELARLVAEIGGRGNAEITPGPYEAGEMVDGKPISFEIDDRSPLWRPKFTPGGGHEEDVWVV